MSAAALSAGCDLMTADIRTVPSVRRSINWRADLMDADVVEACIDIGPNRIQVLFRIGSAGDHLRNFFRRYQFGGLAGIIWVALLHRTSCFILFTNATDHLQLSCPVISLFELRLKR